MLSGELFAYQLTIGSLCTVAAAEQTKMATVTISVAINRDALKSALQQRHRAETAVGANADNGAAALRHRRELLHRLR